MTTNEPQGAREEAPAAVAEAFPAGGYLAEELEARGLSQAEFAATLGRPVQFVAEIVSGTQQITPEAAELIGDALGTGPQLWLNLQDTYRQWKASQAATLTDISNTPCPACGERTLTIEMRMTAKPIGEFSLAGVGMKVSATNKPWLICTNCGVEAEGKLA